MKYALSTITTNADGTETDVEATGDLTLDALHNAIDSALAGAAADLATAVAFKVTLEGEGE